MRSLIVLALLAFLAVGFVAARPAEEEESSVAVENEPEEATSNDEAADEAADDVEDNDEDADTEDNDEDEDEDEEDNEEDTSDTTTAAPKKQVRPFWPKHGGHGPVVVRHGGLLLSKA
ncbi:hypothetical protein KR018_012528 [Drosophila ironensis]|nr:hypothetical protein KR018_012528 [Drosophila ironensis]